VTQRGARSFSEGAHASQLDGSQLCDDGPNQWLSDPLSSGYLVGVVIGLFAMRRGELFLR